MCFPLLMFRGGREVRGSAFPSEAAGCTLAKAWNVPFALSGKGRRVLPYYQRAFSMKEKIAPRCGRARFGLGALRNATVPVRNAIPGHNQRGRCANTGLRWLWGTVTGIPSFREERSLSELVEFFIVIQKILGNVVEVPDAYWRMWAARSGVRVEQILQYGGVIFIHVSSVSRC